MSAKGAGSGPPFTLTMRLYCPGMKENKLCGGSGRAIDMFEAGLRPGAAAEQGRRAKSRLDFCLSGNCPLFRQNRIVQICRLQSILAAVGEAEDSALRQALRQASGPLAQGQRAHHAAQDTAAGRTKEEESTRRELTMRNTNLTALVTLFGGSPEEVVIGTDTDALHARGRAFVERHGANADYGLCGLSILASARTGPPGVVLEDIAAWAQEAASEADLRSPEEDAATFESIARHARRGLTAVSEEGRQVDVQALAERAVACIGDVFYEPETYGDGEVECPQCGAVVARHGEACPERCSECGRLLESRDHLQYERVVSCVADAIRAAVGAQLG